MAQPDMNVIHSLNCGLAHIIQEGYWYKEGKPKTCHLCGAVSQLWKFSKGGRKWLPAGEYPEIK